MERPLRHRKPQYVPGRPILVIGILFNNDSIRACFSNLLFANVPFHSTLESMLGEADLAFPELAKDILQDLSCLLSPHLVCAYRA